MKYDNLPIFKSALDLCVYTDNIVKNCIRYHKYGIGEELKTKSRELLFLINLANINKGEQRVRKITQLRNSCENLKMLIILTNELKAYKNFKQFEFNSKLSVDVCRQAQNWLTHSARILK